MMKLKNSNTRGFALMEVMVALVVISFSVTALMALAGTIAKLVRASRISFEQVQALSSVLVQAHQEQWDKQDQKKQATPHDIVVEYQSSKVSEKSKLHANKGLRREVVSITGDKKVFHELIAFRYVEEKSS